MEIETLANLAEILGGLAVITSLFYVGYQIRQGSKIALAESTLKVLDTYTFHHFLAANPAISALVARGLSEFSTLSNADQRTFHSTLHPLFNQMEIVHVQYELGYLSKLKFEGWMLTGAAIISTPGGSQFWESERMVLAEDFVTCIEQQVVEQQVGPQTLYQLYPFYRQND